MPTAKMTNKIMFRKLGMVMLRVSMCEMYGIQISVSTEVFLFDRSLIDTESTYNTQEFIYSLGQGAQLSHGWTGQPLPCAESSAQGAGANSRRQLLHTKNELQ